MICQTQTVEGADLWQEHCRNAVRKFVMNVVIIDNDPQMDRLPDIPQVATLEDSGMDLAVDDDAEDLDDGDSVSEGTDHTLYVREISDAFSEEEIACAFVFPEEEKSDRETIKARVLASTNTADIVVIDWYLSDKNPVLTTEILQAIAEADVKENGRMRLICVYTGQVNTESVLHDASEALIAGGLIFDRIEEKKCCAVGKHHSLIVLNKSEVNGKELPSYLLDALTRFADGLLPAFALAAVAAVRRNVHHIITRFSSDHDAAYVANRLITNPPGEVAELIRELFVSECDTALGLEKVADNYLEPSQIKHWLESRQLPNSEKAVKLNSEYDVDGVFIEALLENGLSDEKLSINDKQVKFSEGKRMLVSEALHGAKKESKIGESSLARFVALKREMYGNTKTKSAEGWTPSLTLGTLLRQKIQEGENHIFEYYYCLSPACSTIRLEGKSRTFLMLRLVEGAKKANLILNVNSDETKGFHVDTRPMNLRTFEFNGSNTTGRVHATLKGEEGGMFSFKSTDDREPELSWLGEVRRNRATRDMSELNRQWLKLGIKDLEFLRLSGEGKIKAD